MSYKVSVLTPMIEHLVLLLLKQAFKNCYELERHLPADHGSITAQYATRDACVKYSSSDGLRFRIGRGLKSCKRKR